MQVLVADLEADNLLPNLTRSWCVSIGDPRTRDVITYADQAGYPSIKEGLARLSQADRVVMHNGMGYDYWALNKLYPGTLKREQIWDSLIVGRLMEPTRGGHSLDDWGRFFGLPKGSWDDFSQWDPEMAVYCEQDVRITMRLYRYLQRNLKQHLSEGTDWRTAIELEHQVGFVLALQQQHGFRLNVKEAQALEAELRQEYHDVEREVIGAFGTILKPAKADWCYRSRTWINVRVDTPKRKGSYKVAYSGGEYREQREKGASFCKIEEQPFNPGSRPQIAQRLNRKYRWYPEKWTEAGSPQVDESVLKELTFTEAVPLNRMFRLSKQLGQVADGKAAWLKLEVNGRVHGSVNQNGARTGRMTHFAPNMAQVDKKDLRMRAVWLPDAGDRLVGCDADGLELRTLAHYLYKWDHGDYSKAVVEGSKEDETDAHSRNRKAVGLSSRDSAKTFIYALIYGGGNKKIGSIIMIDAGEFGWGVKALQSKGKEARVNIERRITGFGELVALVKKKHQRQGWLPGLDGRRIYSDSDHSALNTLLQGAGAIIMKKALALFHFEIAPARGWVDPETWLPKPNTFNYCANVHDETQSSVNPAITDAYGQEFADAIRLAGERLGVKCPLAGSYDIGDNWKETH